MNVYRITIQPLTAFGTRPLGDTLFGQLCWALRHRYGESRLDELLEGYTVTNPFAVLSDALPTGYLPRPHLPGVLYDDLPGLDRKAAKRRVWLPWERLCEPLREWLRHCLSASEIVGSVPVSHPQPHNSLHRLTGATGGEGFAPYTATQHWYGDRESHAVTLTIHALIDEDRLLVDELRQALEDMGRFGFGRDASIGLGKFEVLAVESASLPVQAGANAWLTLAPCAPQGLGLDPERSYYQPFTRFGRHGDIGVHLGSPFKTPVLMAQTGAVLACPSGTTTHTDRRFWLGQGLGGDGRLTRNEALTGTVQQGYAPVVGVALPERISA